MGYSDNVIFNDKDRIVVSQIKQEAIDEYKLSLKLSHQISTTRLHESLINELTNKYDQAIITNMHIVKPDLRTHQLLPHSVLDDTLTRLANSMALTLLKSETGLDSIASYVNNENYKMYYDYISEKISYGVLSTCSPYILGMLSYYVNELYIFHYIRDNIVRPNIIKLVEHTRMIKSEDLSKTYTIEQSNKLQDAVNLFILSILVTMDTVDASKALNTLSECKINREEVMRIINSSQFAVPTFIKDIIISDNVTQTEQAKKDMLEFINEYSRTFSYDNTTKLLRKYSEMSMNLPDKLITTYKERNKLNSTDIKTLIDGFTLEENEIISRLLVFNYISPEQHKIIKENKYLSNIKSIIDTNRTADMHISIDSNIITIKSSTHEPKSFYYKQDDIQMYLQDPFNIFNASKEYVRDLFDANDIRCSLFQTGMNKKEEKQRLYSKSYTQLGTPEQRVADRNRRIQVLLNSLASSNPEQVTIANELISGNITRIKYMNPRQSDSYKVDNPVKLLLILAETEGIYRKIKSVNEVKQKETQEKEQKLELSKNNVKNSNIDINTAIKNIHYTYDIMKNTQDKPSFDPRENKTLF